MKRILFICTGNTCRSPMAEALLRKMAMEQGIAMEVKSAGISALHGGNASHHAFQVLKEKGIEPTHSSQRVTEDLVQWADIILTMTSHHKYIVLHQFPASLDKIYALKEYAYEDNQIAGLQQALDQNYVEKETKRFEFKNRYRLKGDQEWPEEVKVAYNKEIKALQQCEEELVTKLQHLLAHHDIHDPFGGSVEDYRVCAGEIEKALQSLVERWG